MSLADSPAADRTIRVLQVLALLFVAAKLAFILNVGPAADEAYYWMWGRIPGLSYFDHPPLHAWLLGLSHLVFGRSLLALRWLTLLTMAGTFWIFALWAKRLAGAGWERFFWTGVVIYLASPTFGIFGTVAFHDHLLIFLCLASGHFFIAFLSGYEAGSPRHRHLYLAATLLGLAALTKYSAVFLGLGVAGAVLMQRSYRGLLRDPHLWLAALLALAIQAPVIVWNFSAGFASFRFHLGDRHGASWLESPDFSTVHEFPLVSAILVSPFLIPVFFRFFVAHFEPGFERTAKRLAILVFWLSTLTFLVVSLFDYVNWWWNLVAYILVLPVAAKYMGRFLFWGHVGWGFVLTALFLFNAAVIPMQNLGGGYDWRLAPLYGWEQLEVSARAAVEKYHSDFIAADGPEIASLTGFSLDTTNVMSLSTWPNQYDFWFDEAAHAGQNAVIVLDGEVDPAIATPFFAKITPVEDIEIARFGTRIRGFRILYGEGYVPPPAEAAP